jgi:dipeptidase E
MNSIILTSGPAFSIKKGNGERKSIRLRNEALVKHLKNNIDGYNNLLFICSSPDDYEKNELYSSVITKSLSLSGFKFDMVDLIDSRNWLFTKGLINNSNLVILLGGHPLNQMSFFEDIELKDKLRKYKGCLMAISAGTINLATNDYCSKDDDIEESCYYKGLGLVDINVEPHFDINDKTRIDSILNEDSKKKPFFALPDDSIIVYKDNQYLLEGEGYYFKDGTHTKVNGNITNLVGGK